MKRRIRPAGALLTILSVSSMFISGSAVAARDTPAPFPLTPQCGSGAQIVVAPNVTSCTHGPDPAPDGIDIFSVPSRRQLRARAAASQPNSADLAPVTLSAAAPGEVPCIGTGSSGQRLQAIYAYWEGDASRFAEMAPLIRIWAGGADTIIDDSAALTGGSRHLRWAHDAACQPIVSEFALSGGAASDFNAMAAELFAAGFDRYDRRYVVWADISGAYCGIAMNIEDETPGPDNLLNGVPAAGFGLMARIDLPCWGNPAPGTPIEVHEIMHTLGAVQPHSPHSSSVINGDGSVVWYGHCIDESDLMCYADGTPKSLITLCASGHERLLDCGNDDYFHINPSSGTYLATNWNTANSSFLITVDPVAGFTDISSSPFAADIAWLAGSGITKGCTADQERFCPRATMTREQMAAFLDRALGLAPTGFDYFTDDDSSLFEAEINRLAAAGITTGCGGGNFCPGTTVTREQMAAFLHRALK